jgi:predicted ester cyclase
MRIGMPSSSSVVIACTRNFAPIAGFLATSRWLPNAFSDLRFELQEVIAEGGLVVAATTMTGQHTGAFNGIEPTGKRINHKQVHIFTIVDGQLTHHRAVRDDLGLLLQLGCALKQHAVLLNRTVP